MEICGMHIQGTKLSHDNRLDNCLNEKLNSQTAEQVHRLELYSKKMVSLHHVIEVSVGFFSPIAYIM